jgi:hypothetical protein
MKKIFCLLFSLAILLAVICCEENHSGNPVNPLVGQWLDMNSCDSCLLFQFGNDHNMVIFYLSTSLSDTFQYLLSDNDLLQIGDPWNSEYPVSYYTNDSIEIHGFTLSVIPENRSTVLKRIKN